MVDSGFLQSLLLVAAGSALTLLAQILLGGFADRRAERSSLRERRRGTHDKAFDIVGKIADSALAATQAVKNFQLGSGTRQEVDDAVARLFEDMLEGTHYSWTMYRDAAPKLMMDYVGLLVSAHAIQVRLADGFASDQYTPEAVAADSKRVLDAAGEFRRRARALAGFHKVDGWDRLLRWAGWWRTVRAKR